MARRIVNLRGFIFLSSILLLAVLSPARGYAMPNGDAGLTMEVRAGFDGSYKVGEWIPFIVTLTNEGADVSGDLTTQSNPNNAPLGIPATQRHVELAHHSRKEITIYTVSTQDVNNIVVVFRNGGTTYLSAQAKLQPVDNPVMLIGVISDDPTLLNNLSQLTLGKSNHQVINSYGYGGSTAGAVSTKSVVAHLTLSDLPNNNGAALSGLDVLVFDTVATSNLTPGQIAALDEWVSSNKTLVIAGGPDWNRTTRGLGSFLPVKPDNTIAVNDLPALSKFVHNEKPVTTSNQPFNIAHGTLDPQSSARVVVQEQDGNPLVAVRPLGSGAIYYTAFTFSSEPMRSWDGGTKFWQTILNNSSVDLSVAGATRLTAPQQFYNYGNYNGSGPYYNAPSGTETNYFNVFRSPGERSNSLGISQVGWFALFLLIYILIVGPLNYFILRKFDRREFSWLTIPVIVTVFAFGGYYMTTSIRGSDLQIDRYNIIYSNTDDPNNRIDTFYTVRSPSSRTYNISLGENSLATLIELYGTRQNNQANQALYLDQTSNPATVRELAMSTYSIRNFIFESSQNQGPYLSKANLTKANNQLSGTVKNSSSYIIRDAYIYQGGNSQPVHDIAAGATVNVNLGFSSGKAVINSLYTPANYSAEMQPHVQAMLQVAVDQANDNSNSSTAYLVGWLDQAPLNTQITPGNPKTTQLNLVVVRLPINNLGPVSSTELPTRVTLSPIANPTLIRTSGNEILLTAKVSDVEFVAPEGVSPHQFTLQAVASNDPSKQISGSFEEISIQFYDSTTKLWRNINFNPEGRLTMPFTEGDMDSKRHIRFRLTTYGETIFLQDLTLTLN